MSVVELTGLVAGAAETGQDFAALVVEHMHLLIPPIHDVHKALLVVGRERYSPYRARIDNT